MGTERHVKLFKNGRNQAVRIPRELELPGEDAVMRKEGDRLIFELSPPRALLAVLATLEPLDEDFPPIPDPPRLRPCHRNPTPSLELCHRNSKLLHSAGSGPNRQRERHLFAGHNKSDTANVN